MFKLKGHRRTPSATIAGARVQLKSDNKLCRGSPPTLLVLVCVVLSGWMVIDYWQSQAKILGSLRAMHFTSDSKPIVLWTSPNLRNRTKKHKAPDQVYKGDAVYYVKVYKAASTSIQMILNRYGAMHDLKFASFNTPLGRPYPKVASPLLLYEHPSTPKYRKVDILHEHAIYDAPTVNSYLRPRYKLIGSLREPLSQLRSLMNSFDLGAKYGISPTKDAVETFLENPDAFKGKLLFESLKNCQAQHYGFRLYNNYQNESGFLEHIDETFDTILISERLDESLLLMKRKFGWSINDIMYLSRQISPTTDTPSLSKERESRIETMHRAYSNADYMMFEYFSRKLQSELDGQPSEFWQQLLNYKAIKDKFRAFCLSMCSVVKDLGMLNATQARHLMESTVFHVPGSLGEEDITMTYSDCVLLAMSPSTWQTAIKVTQYPNLFCSAKTRALKEPNKYYDPSKDKVEDDKQGTPQTLMAHHCNPKHYVTYGFPDRSIYLDLFTTEGSLGEEPFCKE